MAFDLDPAYKQVPERIADFKAKHPDGCLRPADPSQPYRVETLGERTFIVYTAAAYRTPDDPTPGIGIAWEPFPGKTPYTRDSELMNAETSAWGRAIVAVLASESKAIASAEDVRNRRADQNPPSTIPCRWCDFTAPADDREPMRAHLVAAHDFERQEDGSVVAPAKDDETKRVERAAQVAEENGLVERAEELRRQAAEKQAPDVKLAAAGDRT